MKNAAYKECLDLPFLPGFISICTTCSFVMSHSMDRCKRKIQLTEPRFTLYHVLLILFSFHLMFGLSV